MSLDVKMQNHVVAWKYAGCSDVVLEALKNDHAILCDCWNIEHRAHREWVVDYVKRPDNVAGLYVCADGAVYRHAKPVVNS